MSEPLWVVADIAKVLNIALDEPPLSKYVTGVSIDSRTVLEGDLFIAIKGNQTDGHLYVDAAVKAGASAIIVDQNYSLNDLPQDVAVFVVEDTLEALNKLAIAARTRMSGQVIAVTGSVGKTGTKEMLKHALSEVGPTHASEKSYNNLWGVPLSLARMPKSTAFGIFEIGMNHAGEITPLTKLVRPHVALITWVDAVHIEFFASIEEIADAKAEIFEGVEADGAAILPIDNLYYERLLRAAQAKHAKIFSFGEAADADGRLINYTRKDDRSFIQASILDQDTTFELQPAGLHLASNAIAALMACKLVNVDLAVVSEAISRFESLEGRGRNKTYQTKDGTVLIIDETYNASPASMAASLRSFGAMISGRKIAVLGDMRELGLRSKDFHESLQNHIETNSIDLVFCSGEMMAYLYEALPDHKKGGYSKTSDGLCSLLIETVKGGDAIMIKGSYGSHMNIVRDALHTHFVSSARNKYSRCLA